MRRNPSLVDVPVRGGRSGGGQILQAEAISFRTTGIGAGSVRPIVRGDIFYYDWWCPKARTCSNIERRRSGSACFRRSDFWRQPEPATIRV